MKSPFLRALSVGAALLIPASAFTMLGTGVAGATPPSFGSGSYIALGAAGSLDLAGQSYSSTTENWTVSTSTTGVTATIHVALTVTGTPVTSVKFKQSGETVTIHGGPFDGCVISSGLPPVTISGSGGVLSNTGTPIGAVTVTGASCSTPSALEGALETGSVTGVLYV